MVKFDINNAAYLKQLVFPAIQVTNMMMSWLQYN